MSERRKKAPKIAWRELQKAQEGEAGAAPAPAAEPSPAMPPATTVAAPTPAAEPSAASPSHLDASSPVALAARLDEAYAAMMAETEREQGAGAAPAPAAGGPPPDDNVASATGVTVTIAARSESSTPAASSTAEAEVQRILARLATYVPVARAASVAGSSADADVPALVAPRGPAPLDEEDAAPLIAPSGLREAARVRHGRVELLLFRAGGELFALPLGAVEEAIEAPLIETLPEMPSAMLGVFNLRERLVPTYSPGPALGVGLAAPTGAALLVRAAERRLALAADDVEDVMELDLSTLRDPPVVEDTDGILLGVARFGRDLVGILDADALISACLGGRNVENP